MNEAICNRAVVKSMDWGYKIPDPPRIVATSSSQRPFDGFGVVNGRTTFFEGKFQKGYKAFNLSRIKPHQLAALHGVSAGGADVYIFLYIQVKRSLYLHYWTLDELKSIMVDHKSITKKMLEAEVQSGRCIKMESSKFDLQKLKR